MKAVKVLMTLVLVVVVVLLGHSLIQKRVVPAPVLINSSEKVISEVKLGDKILVSEAGLSPGDSQNLNIDTVGTNIAFTFKAGSQLINTSINLRQVATEDSRIVAILINKDFTVRVVKGLV